MRYFSNFEILQKYLLEMQEKKQIYKKLKKNYFRLKKISNLN